MRRLNEYPYILIYESSYFLLSDVNAPWDFYRAQIRVFEYAAMVTGLQIKSTYFAAIINKSGKIWACAGTSWGRYRPRVGTQRYLPILPSTCFDSHNIIRINLLNLRKYLEAKFNYMKSLALRTQVPFKSDRSKYEVCIFFWLIWGLSTTCISTSI